MGQCQLCLQWQVLQNPLVKTLRLKAQVEPMNNQVVGAGSVAIGLLVKQGEPKAGFGAAGGFATTGTRGKCPLKNQLVVA